MCTLQELNDKIEKFQLGDWLSRKYGINTKYFVYLIIDVAIASCGGAMLFFACYVALHGNVLQDATDTALAGINIAIAMFLMIFGLTEVSRDTTKRFVGKQLDKKIKDGLITLEAGMQLEKDYDLGFLLIATLHTQSQKQACSCETISIIKDHNPSGAEHHD